MPGLWTGRGRPATDNPRVTGRRPPRGAWLAILAVNGVLAVGLSFVLVPWLTRAQLLGMPVSWGLLAFGCYPVLVLLAWRYVRLAERNERAFARVVERS